MNILRIDKIISRFNGLAFNHIPKTGGSYIRKIALKKHGIPAGHWVCVDEAAGCLGDRAWEENCLGISELKGALIFSVVRNPFDLLVSMYNYGWPHPRNEKPFPSFRCFAEAYCDPDYKWPVPWQKNFLFFQIFDKDSICRSPLVLRTERLDEGLEKLCAQFDIVPSISPDRVNPSRPAGKNYKHYYSENLRYLVKKKCERELDLFGYDFDGPDDRIIIDTSGIKYNPLTDGGLQ